MYCSHCGNCKVTGLCPKCKTDFLPRCTKAVREFHEKIAPYKHVLSMGIHVSYLYGTDKEDKKIKKQKRGLKVQELLNKASALLNSESGFIIIHLVGLNPEDRFTGAFDEFADVKLQSLINDGRLFADVYKKQRMKGYPNGSLTEYTDFLVLTVEKSDNLVTSDLKTKYATDDSIIDVEDSQLKRFIKTCKDFKEEHHKLNIENLCDISGVHEDRNVQLKEVFSTDLRDDKLIQTIIHDLKLPTYVSAFTKNEDGGSFLAGASEKRTVVNGYLTKEVDARPVNVQDSDYVSKQIIENIDRGCLVCDYSGTVVQPKDLLKILFVPHISSRKKVIQVSVRPVRGVVFYDKDGPEAYTMEVLKVKPDDIKRMSQREWFEAFTQ